MVVLTCLKRQKQENHKFRASICSYMINSKLVQIKATPLCFRTDCTHHGMQKLRLSPSLSNQNLHFNELSRDENGGVWEDQMVPHLHCFQPALITLRSLKDPYDGKKAQGCHDRQLPPLTWMPSPLWPMHKTQGNVSAAHRLFSSREHQQRGDSFRDCSLSRDTRDSDSQHHVAGKELFLPTQSHFLV